VSSETLSGMIDVHFHLIPQFYREAVRDAGTMLATASYPDWSPQLALDLMDKHGIAFAITSTVWPGAGFLHGERAASFARAGEVVDLQARRMSALGH
jgi:6-methylsalicylate decarboxylase